jgi:hypothetical protein
MATGSILSVCNRALLAVGARAQVSSVSPSDGSVEADACTTLFQPTFEQLARTAHWNCLGKQATLSLIQAAQGTPENPDGTTLPLPPTPWLYAYAYPSDSLDIRYIVPSYPANTGASTPQTTVNNSAGTWLPTGGQIPYKVQTISGPTNTPVLAILCNQSQAQAIYTLNLANPQSWDSLFQEAMVASLGAYLVPALSLDLPLLDRCVKQAEMAISQARARDGNEGVTTMDHVPDWIQARNCGQGWGNGWLGGYNQGYNMVWPGYGDSGVYGD